MDHLLWTARYIAVILVVGIPLAIPIIIFREKSDVDNAETIEAVEHREYRQLVFYLFAWLETCWLGFWVSDVIGLGLPYVFRFVAR